MSRKGSLMSNERLTEQSIGVAGGAKEGKMNVTVDLLASLLDDLAENYFVKGEMTHEVALANILLAQEYAGALCGKKSNGRRLGFFEANLSVATQLYPKNSAHPPVGS